MTDKFIKHCIDNRSKYEAWGRFVVDEICKSLTLQGLDCKKFLKIEPHLRVKDEASIVSKIIRHNIDNPFVDVIDVVGVRFVVLLTTDIKNIAECINRNDAWNARLTRDAEEQQLSNPELFDYQSTHYCLSPAKAFTYENIEITSDIFCEVQIRTILQHAYAELTHDNIYKPVKTVSKKAKRFVARSMALMESTDHLFCETISELESDNRQRNDFYSSLAVLYSKTVVAKSNLFSVDFNYEVIETYADIMFPDGEYLKIDEYWMANEFLFDKVRDYSRKYFLFKQPICILLFWLVEYKEYEALKRWSYGSLREELRFICSDLGVAMGDRL